MPNKNQKIAALTLIASALGTIARADEPPANPYLAANKYAITHFDSSQSDAFPYAVPTGTFHVDPTKAPRVVTGPVNIMTLASTSPDFMWGVSSEGVSYINVANGGFEEVTRLAAPGEKVIPPAAHLKLLNQKFTSTKQIASAVKDIYGVNWSRIVNGVYALADADNHVYFNSASGKLTMFGLVDEHNPKAGIKVIRTVDMRPIIGENTHLVGMGLTYDGKFITASNRTISVFDRSLEGKPQTIRFEPNEFVSNSFAIDEKNHIYIASDKYMRKIVWDGKKLSDDPADGAWKAAYDTGRQPPTVKFGTGTGSTPTLMGFGNDPDKLVVITDGADHMKLVAFWRDVVPAGWTQRPRAKSPRIAGQIPVTVGLKTLPEFVQSEQSVVVKNYGAFVVNNIAKQGEADKLVDVLAVGPIDQAGNGVERFEWDTKTHAWHSVWARPDIVSISMVPSTSTASGIVFVGGYHKETGWEVTGMDWDSGKTVHRVIFGQSNFGNGAYATIQYVANGDLIYNSIGGPMRVALKNGTPN